jgi:hypothetical protein
MRTLEWNALGHRKELAISALLLASVIVLLWFCLGTGLVLGDQENQNDTRLELGVWTAETLFEQTFVASRNALTRIDFFVDSYYPWESPYLECRLYALNTPASPDTLSYAEIQQAKMLIRTRRINGWAISGHMPNACVFAPVPDSQGKRYLFTLQSPGMKGGSGSILEASPVDRLERGSFFLNGKRQTGDLAMRVLYRQPRLQVLQQSLANVALQKSFPFSAPLTYYLLGVGYLVLLGGLWWVSTRRT